MVFLIKLSTLGSLLRSLQSITTKYLGIIWNSPTLMTWGSFFSRALSLFIVLPLLLTRLRTEEIALWYLFITIISFQKRIFILILSNQNYEFVVIDVQDNILQIYKKYLIVISHCFLSSLKFIRKKNETLNCDYIALFLLNERNEPIVD